MSYQQLSNQSVLPRYDYDQGHTHHKLFPDLPANMPISFWAHATPEPLPHTQKRAESNEPSPIRSAFFIYPSESATNEQVEEWDKLLFDFYASLPENIWNILELHELDAEKEAGPAPGTGRQQSDVNQATANKPANKNWKRSETEKGNDWLSHHADFAKDFPDGFWALGQAGQPGAEKDMERANRRREDKGTNWDSRRRRQNSSKKRSPLPSSSLADFPENFWEQEAALIVAYKEDDQFERVERVGQPVKRGEWSPGGQSSSDDDVYLPDIDGLNGIPYMSPDGPLGPQGSVVRKEVRKVLVMLAVGAALVGWLL